MIDPTIFIQFLLRQNILFEWLNDFKKSIVASLYLYHIHKQHKHIVSVAALYGSLVHAFHGSNPFFDGCCIYET